MLRSFLLFLAFAPMAFAAAAACRSGKPTSAQSPPAARAAAKKPTRPEPRARSTVVAQVPAGTLGPRLFANERGRVAVWAAPGAEQGGWYTEALPYAEPGGPPRRVVEQEPASSFFELGEFGSDGVLVASVKRAGTLFVIEAFELGYDGTLRRGPEPIVEQVAEIYWLSSVPTPRGALLVWAQRAASGADIYLQEVTLGGEPRPPRRVATGALAWQMKVGPSGAILATSEGKPEKAQILLRELSPEGVQHTVEVDREVRGALDLDFAVSGQQAWVVYGKRGKFATHLHSARVGLKEHSVRKAGPMTPPRGEQTLLRLVDAPKREGTVVAVWEEPSETFEHRVALLAPLDDDGRASAPAALLPLRDDSDVLPTFASTQKGLTLIATAPYCASLPAEDRPPGCDDDATTALIVQSAQPGQHGLEGSAEVLRLSQMGHRRARLAWDLRCNSHGCFSLAANGATPATVFLLELDAPRGARPPMLPAGSLARPHVLRREVITRIDAPVDIAGQMTKAGALLAWIDYFDPNRPYARPSRPAPDGRMAPVRALLKTQLIDGDQAQLLRETVISYRARSLGGVALSAPKASPAGAKAKRLLVWAALDGQHPQLFVTLLDEQGRKVAQKMLTRGTGEVTEAAVGSTPGGFLIAWVQGGEPDAQIHALGVDERLEIVQGERALTQTARTPTGLTLACEKNHALLVWSDARGSDKVGYGDLYALTLDAESLQPSLAPRRLTTSDKHSHSAQLSKTPQGWRLWWLESDPALRGGADSDLHSAGIDLGARLGSAPQALTLGGSTRSFSARCPSSGACRVALMVERDGQGELWAGRIPVAGGKTEESEATLRPISALTGPAQASAPPLLLGDRIIYVDQITSSPSQRPGPTATEGEAVAGSVDYVLERITVDW